MTEDFDFDVDGELGFEPAVPVTGAEPTEAGVKPARPRIRGRRSMRRRLGTAAVLLVALMTMGGAYAAFASSSGASDTSTSSEDIAAGKQMYEVSCITCHGANLQGVKDRGVPLLGVGGAAVYFQVSTGRMPLAGQGPDSDRKTAKFDEQQTEQLAAYVQSIGGGPVIPQGTLRDSDIADGGELFRLNCASCHNFVGEGGALSSGKAAPSLQNASDLEIYTAMLTGPENMPVFGDNQLTPDEKRSVINYVQTIKAQADPGGAGIGRIGPVSEGLVIWVVGIGALLFGIFWMGSKA